MAAHIQTTSNDADLEKQNSALHGQSGNTSESTDHEDEPDLRADLEADLEKVPTNNTQSSNRGGPLAKAPTAQDWTGPDDLENPMTWPMIKKVYHISIVGLFCFTATLGSSVYTPGYVEVEEHFHVSTTAAFLPLSLYVLGLAFGPIIAAPISETHGRRIVYLTTFPPFLLFILGAGFAQNFGTLLVCRFFAGAFGAPSLAVGSGTISDLIPPLNRATASSIFILAPFLGPALGPPLGGFVAMKENWRWTQWCILFLGTGAYIYSLFQSETYKKIILQQRAKRLNIPPPPNPIPSGAARIKFILTVTVFRPIHMIFTEPIVLCFSMYTALNFSILFGFFAAFPIVFDGLYHFNLGEGGLAFLGLGIGCLIGSAIFITTDRITYRKWTLQARARGDHTPLAPEHRLYAAMLGCFLLPIGLFWFAWTSRSDIHWISPMLATIPFATGNLLVFCSCIVYLIDVYGPMGGASAAAANGLLRYIFGAAFPLFTQQMYYKLGIGWATSLLGFITLGLMPIPWILMKWGPDLRARSRFGVVKN